MFSAIRYILLFIVTILFQIFFFDRLSLSVFFAPMIYTLFIIMLPVNTSSAATLACGLVTGITMDIAMGTAGLNTIATLAVSYLRRPLLSFIVGRDGLREVGAPSPKRMGNRQFFEFIAAMVVIHGAVFNLFEVFSATNIVYTLLRFTVSTLASLLFIWLLGRLFTYKSASTL